MTDFSEAVRQLQEEKKIPLELIQKEIQEMLLAAYKKKYGTDENAVIKFDDDKVSVFAKKEIVKDEEIEDPVMQISLDEALSLNEECELGDELLIEINPQAFERGNIQTAKQQVKKGLFEIQKDTIYSQFKEREGEIIIGYCNREQKGNFFIDIGSAEGILPARFQSPREVYRPGDKIKVFIYKVEKSDGRVQVILSRTHVDLVKKICEQEVPEINEGIVEIVKIVREPGYRTKLAVRSKRENIDPVGACVGLKGVRIQVIVKELEGERIDILKYSEDPALFVKSALTPAQIMDVFILDGSKRQALAIVDESQLSLAIGKQGMNVRLANRLVDWNIDVKTKEQAIEAGFMAGTGEAASALFDDHSAQAGDEITRISELPDFPERLTDILIENGINLIEDLVAISQESLLGFNGVTEEDITLINNILEESVEICEEDNEADVVSETSEEQDSESVDSDDEEYECPECGTTITLEMEQCPNCGVGLSFEFEEED